MYLKKKLRFGLVNNRTTTDACCGVMSL